MKESEDTEENFPGENSIFEAGNFFFLYNIKLRKAESVRLVKTFLQ